MTLLNNRIDFSIGLYNSDIYIVGGKNDENDSILTIEKFNISNRIIYCFLKDVNYKSKKIPNIKKIEKCHRPVYIEIKAEYND